MSIFVQFYVVLLGFVNFHMYHSLNLVYPPKLAEYGKDSEEDVSEKLAALNTPISKTGTDVTEENEIDQFPTVSIFTANFTSLFFWLNLNIHYFQGDSADIEEQKQEIMKLQNLKNLFKDQKFFLNNEVPREPLVFVIRCFGGLVSWDKACSPGATFDEDDETIAYQIVDRPNKNKHYLSR